MKVFSEVKSYIDVYIQDSSQGKTPYIHDSINSMNFEAASDEGKAVLDP